jgi:hypothetical protein
MIIGFLAIAVVAIIVALVAKTYFIDSDTAGRGPVVNPTNSVGLVPSTRPTLVNNGPVHSQSSSTGSLSPASRLMNSIRSRRG